MKIKLSEALKYCFCQINDNRIDSFSMNDILSCINSAKFMLNAMGGYDFDVENDCFKNNNLGGALKDCAGEMMPDVWMINKEEFMKVVFSSLTAENKPSKDEAKFYSICMNIATGRTEKIRANAQQKIINYTKETNTETNDENISAFSRWVRDNSEQIKTAAHNFFEQKNHCVICGKYTIRVAKPDSPSND